jgi:hypothetical protein
MVANWQYGEECRWWVRCSCCRVGYAHSTDFPSVFLSPFILFFFSPSPLKPCGCCTCLIMIQNVRPHPTSTPLHDTFYVNVMISVTFECDCPFLLQFDVAGDGSTTTNIKMNTKWLCNTCRSHPTSKPLQEKFYVPFLLQVVVAGDGSTTTNIKMNTKLNDYRLKLTLYKFRTVWRTVGFFENIPLSILSKFRTHDQSIFISWCHCLWWAILAPWVSIAER